MYLLYVILFITYIGVGILIIRETIGEGLIILIGSGLSVWWIWLAIVLWPVLFIYWAYQVYREKLW